MLRVTLRNNKVVFPVGLFQNCFDAADAGARRFFLGDFEVAKFPGAADVRSATDFDGNFFFVIGRGRKVGANSIDSDAVRIAITEGAMGMKVVECIIFIIFSKDNGEILRNPFVDAGFDLREFFGGELMVDIEVEAEALGSEIAAFLLNGRVNFLLEGSEEEVTGGMILDGLVARVGEAAFEHTF